MQKIALRSIPDWFAQGWNDCNSDWGNIAQFGAVAFGVRVAMEMIVRGFQFAGQVLGNVQFDVAVSVPLGFLYSALIGCGLSGVALARLHGRDAEWDDFKQDVPTYVQAILADVLASLGMFMVVGILSGLFFLPAILEASKTSGPPDDGIMAVSMILGMIVAVVGLIIFAPFKMFVIPLTVDKRMDFWSAIRTSFDCVRRDWFGLALFNVLIFLILTISNCCCILVIFLMPLYYAMLMASYRSYFGLEPDRYRPSWLDPPQTSAYFSQYDGPRPFGDYTGDRGDPRIRPADPGKISPWTPPPPEATESEAGPMMPPPESTNAPMPKRPPEDGNGDPPSFPFAPHPPEGPPSPQNEQGVEKPPEGPPPE